MRRVPACGCEAPTALYSKRAHRGMLFKAKRGTLNSRWAQRFFWLRGNNLSYYREPLQIQNLINARASAQSVLGAILPRDPRRSTMVRADAAALLVLLPRPELA